MPESIRELATQIVSAYASKNPMTQVELFDLIDLVVSKLKEMKETEEQGFVRSSGWTQKQVRLDAVDPGTSIGQDKITCLECRKEFKILTERHLKSAHNMTKDFYRTKYRLSGEPLVCKELSEKRKKSALERKLGAKAVNEAVP